MNSAIEAIKDANVQMGVVKDGLVVSGKAVAGQTSKASTK